MKKLIVTLFATAVLLSCEKDENVLSDSETYYTKLVSEERYRIFTSDGEVKNEDVRNLIISKSNEVLPSLITIRQKEDIRATLISEDKVFFERGSTIADTFLIKTKGSLTYWEKSDTTTYYPSIQSEFNKTLNFSDTSLFVYKPLYYEEVEVPHSTGYLNRIKQKTCFYIEKEGNALIMPFVDYCLLTDMGLQRPAPQFFTYLATNNRLKETLNLTLSEKDTLIIREYVQQLTKDAIPTTKKSVELIIYNANSWQPNSSALSVVSQAEVKLFKNTGSANVTKGKETYKEISDENGIVNFYDIEPGNYFLIATKEDLSNLKNGLLINGVFMNAQDTVHTMDKPYQDNPEIGGLKYEDMNGDGVISELDVTEGDYIEVKRSEMLKRIIYMGK
ncbi:hypothetical protein ACT3CD_06265 [Geofilum sp. OHC36d9]|uniref:hypothetical protein n=1 Tax=Geofilum sp. OHC36d9 TaxID=3458413 RepID=UPI0040342D71